MTWWGTAPIPRWLLLVPSLATGCTALHRNAAPTIASPPLTAKTLRPDCSDPPASSFRQASFDVPARGSIPVCASTSEGTPFVGMSELLVDALVAQVLGRNPSLAQMTGVWRAASA